MCLYLGVLSYYLFGSVYNLHQNYLVSIGSDCIQHKLYMKNNKLAVGTIPLHVPKSQQGKLTAFSVFTHSSVLPKPARTGWKSTTRNELHRSRGRQDRTGRLGPARGDGGCTKKKGSSPVGVLLLKMVRYRTSAKSTLFSGFITFFSNAICPGNG